MLTIRGLLEAGQHPHNSFVTLTYDDKHLPTDGCVSVRESQLFLKLLRYHIGPVRYLLCGEYGERNWRPHYHAILFGVRDGYCVSKAWKKGFVHCSGVGVESISYVSGYCLKGLSTERGMRWAGKKLSPEFVRWSTRPPIGAAAADRISTFYLSRPGSSVLASDRTTSTVVRQGGKLWPLGRYLAARVRDQAGVHKDSHSQLQALSRAERLRSMSQAELNDYIELATGQSSASGFRAEAKYKRMSLEKKL